MSEKKSLEEVAQIVQCEGLGYAVQHYMSGDEIENKTLREFWEEASRLLNQIDTILETYYDD